MKIINIEQRSQEWWDYKVGKISGTRFGQVVSTRENRLLYDIVNEKIDNYIEVDEYVSEDMQYGIDNEDEALRLYSEKSGVKIKRVGIIQSDLVPIHIASPDAISECETIVQEVKCTQDGAIHLQRYFEGFSNKELYQCVNYFAVEPSIKEVHLISYCGYRSERPMFYNVIKRETELTVNRKQVTVQELVDKGLKDIEFISNEINDCLIKWL